MPVVKEYKYRWYERLAVNIVKMGSVPRHIAFIMDGNRRFAKMQNVDKIDGHMKGYEKLGECLKWCLDIGVKEVTTYAFSIENFKRSSEEVNALMSFAAEQFRMLLAEEERLKKEGVKVRIIGNISMLPKDLQEVVAKVMLVTENSDKLFLNIALAYTSREEMANATRNIIGASGDDLKPEDIKEDLVRQCLYTKGSPEPDLLIRTSGESRISDFLMWQLSNTILFFTKVLWPEMSLLEFIFGIFFYQRASFSLADFRQRFQQQIAKTTEVIPDRVKDFLQKQDARRRAYLEGLVNANVKED